MTVELSEMSEPPESGTRKDEKLRSCLPQSFEFADRSDVIGRNSSVLPPVLEKRNGFAIFEKPARPRRLIDQDETRTLRDELRQVACRRREDLHPLVLWPVDVPRMFHQLVDIVDALEP